MVSSSMSLSSTSEYVAIDLRFEGEIAGAGLDADEVAAVADGMSRLAQFISRYDVPDRAFVLHLREVRQGSAIFQFILETAALLNPVIPTLIPTLDLNRIGEYLATLLKLKEFLKSSPPRQVISSAGDNTVSVINSEGATQTVNTQIYNIYQNTYVQDQVSKTIKPIRKRGRRLAISQNQRPLYEAESSIYDDLAFRHFNDNDVVEANTVSATLKVRKIDLESGSSWRFRWADTEIAAEIMDTDFMRQVRDGSAIFRNGDLIRVKLRIEEHRRGKNIRTKYFIDEIIDRVRLD